MVNKEAMKLALEALEDLGMKHFESTGEVLYKDTFTTIKEALAQPEQEPVKFEAVWDSGPTNKDYEDAMRLKRLQQLTSPLQRKPLTDEEIGAILDDPNIAEKHQGNWLVLPYSYARAIEAAHGIKGEA